MDLGRKSMTPNIYISIASRNISNSFKLKRNFYIESLDTNYGHNLDSEYGWHVLHYTHSLKSLRNIHGAGIDSCSKCDMFDFRSRRKNLPLSLFMKALHNRGHILHPLLPHCLIAVKDSFYLSSRHGKTVSSSHVQSCLTAPCK